MSSDEFVSAPRFKPKTIDLQEPNLWPHHNFLLLSLFPYAFTALGPLSIFWTPSFPYSFSWFQPVFSLFSLLFLLYIHRMLFLVFLCFFFLPLYILRLSWVFYFHSSCLRARTMLVVWFLLFFGLVFILCLLVFWCFLFYPSSFFLMFFWGISFHLSVVEIGVFHLVWHSNPYVSVGRYMVSPNLLIYLNFFVTFNSLFSAITV